MGRKDKKKTTKSTALIPEVVRRVPRPSPAIIRRQIQTIQAALEAAQSRDDLWQLADFKDADATLNPQVRRTLRCRARYEAANNPLVARVIETWVTDIVREDGPSLQMNSGDGDMDKLIEEEWQQWWWRNNVAANLRTSVRAEAIDGESVSVIRFTEDGPIVLDMEADRLGETYLSNRTTSNFIDGVALDPVTRRPQSYELLRAHPGTEYLDKISKWNETDIYPASLVLHCFRRTRPEQHRGCPRMTPALPVSGHGRKYIEASAVREQLRAAHWVLYKTSMQAGDESTNEGQWWQEVKLPGKSGISMILPEGFDPVAFPKDTAPSDTKTFQEIVGGQVAGCFTMPLCRALGYGGGGYAEVRAQMEPYHASIQIERAQVWDSEWLAKVFRVFVMHLRAVKPTRRAANGATVALPWESIQTDRATFFWPQRQLVVDPSREKNAEMTDLQMGNKTREELTNCNDLDARDERAATQFGFATKEEYRQAIARATFGAPPAPVQPDSMADSGDKPPL